MLIRKVKVYVYKRDGVRNLYLKWQDPITRRWIRRSSGTHLIREANRRAARLEKDLEEGAYVKQRNLVTWQEFRFRYETEVLDGLANNTSKKAMTTFDYVEKYINPAVLLSVDGDAISKLVKSLCEKHNEPPRKTKGRKKPKKAQPLAESTIAGHLAHLKAALNWACEDVEILDSVPKFPKLRRAKRSSSKTPMKGRPITEEEFERLKSKTASVVGAEQKESWNYLLDGIWYSGLRLGEAVNLSWTDDSVIRPDISGTYGVFLVPAEAEKGHKDRVLPMAPEFAEFLKKIPKRRRKGYVFSPKPKLETNGRPKMDFVSRRICAIGKAAQIRVSNKKYASAQDLRRSFGHRWSKRVMPADLKEMMRHENIETTMRYYVGQNAESTSARAYAAVFGANAGVIPSIGENDTSGTLS